MVQIKRYLILSLNYIQPTVEARSIWIPGLTASFDVTVNGETAYYYESETFDISDGAAGRKLDLSETGAKRKSFDLVNSYGIGGIIPLVGHATVSEDIIGRKLMDSATGVVALDNEKGLAALVQGISVKTPTGSDAYEEVINAVKDFNEANKVKIVSGKAKGGWRATTLIAGPAFYAKMQLSERFIKGSNTTYSVNEAVVGQIGGLTVVYTTDLPATVDFVVMNPNGFLAPKGVSATEVFGQVEGRPGAALAQAEMVYGFKQLDAAQIVPYKEA